MHCGWPCKGPDAIGRGAAEGGGESSTRDMSKCIALYILDETIIMVHNIFVIKWFAEMYINFLFDPHFRPQYVQ